MRRIADQKAFRHLDLETCRIELRSGEGGSHHGSKVALLDLRRGRVDRDAQRFGPEEKEDAAEHAQRMLSEKRSVLLQPYLNRVDEYGETALIYFEGQFSHAIRKGPLLKRKEGPTTELFAKETITARAPDEAELSVGARALRALPFETPLYARVDLIRDGEGAPVVLELELIEPSLFFQFAERSAERFASAVVRRAGG